MIRYSQIKGVGVDLASFRLPLERLEAFMLRFIEWAIFEA